MNRQTMMTQIITMTTAGMVTRKELPEDKDEFFKIIKHACTDLMEVPPVDSEIEEVFKTENPIPIQFSEKLVKLLGNGEKI